MHQVLRTRASECSCCYTLFSSSAAGYCTNFAELIYQLLCFVVTDEHGVFKRLIRTLRITFS